MALCPNRNRKRASHGGGIAGCRGDLQIITTATLVLPCKRMPRGQDGPENLLHSRTLKYGVRISGEQIARHVVNDDYDIQCDVCGWSLNRAIRSVSIRKATRRAGKAVR